MLSKLYLDKIRSNVTKDFKDRADRMKRLSLREGALFTKVVSISGGCDLHPSIPLRF